MTERMQKRTNRDFFFLVREGVNWKFDSDALKTNRDFKIAQPFCSVFFSILFIDQR